jgi:hypothetical protein
MSTFWQINGRVGQDADSLKATEKALTPDGAEKLWARFIISSTSLTKSRLPKLSFPIWKPNTGP